METGIEIMTNALGETYKALERPSKKEVKAEIDKVKNQLICLFGQVGGELELHLMNAYSELVKLENKI